jgi:osmotically-inducible protein OsmY
VTRITLASIAIFAALVIGCSRAPVDDAAITKGVKAKLAAEFGRLEDSQVTQLDRGADKQTVTYISVSSVNGVVTLTGEVRGNKAKTKAGELARSVEQVVSVNNNLSLAPGYSDDAVGDKPSQ